MISGEGETLTAVLIDLGLARRECSAEDDDDEMPPMLKLRLVGCGNFEDTDGVRADIPAEVVDPHDIIFAWCAGIKVRVKSADITNADLHGKPAGRLIIYRIKINRMCQFREHTANTAQFPESRMGDRYTVSNTGAAKLLTVVQSLKDVIFIQPCHRRGKLCKLEQQLFLAAHSQVSQDIILTNDVIQFHLQPGGSPGGQDQA